MRISDWSSDVCSSDLARRREDEPALERHARRLESTLAFEDSPPGAVRIGGRNRIPEAIGFVAIALVDEDRLGAAVVVHVVEQDARVGMLAAAIDRSDRKRGVEGKSV